MKNRFGVVGVCGLAGLAPLLACSAAAWAQTPSTALSVPTTQIAQLQNMSLADVLQVDIGTGTSKLIYQTPGVAYVVTAADIARMGARNMQEVLESIPGLNIYHFQGVVNSALIDLRGLVNERGGYVLFLRDGRPLRLISDGTMPEIFRLPVAFIERIEVVRGPASAVYGTDALAGAVNIITRTQPGEGGFRGDGSNARAGWTGTSGRVGSVDWSAVTSRSRIFDDVVTRSRQRNSVFTQRFGQEYTDLDVKLRAGNFKADFWALNYLKEETGNPANPLGLTTVRTQHRHANLGYTQSLSPTTEFTGDIFYTFFRGARTAVVQFGVPTNGDNGESRITTSFSLTETRFADHRLRFTGGTVRERAANYQPGSLAPQPPGAPPPVTPPNSRRFSFVSIQDEFAFQPAWELTAGLRIDDYQDVGKINTPRLGLVWSINPHLSMKLLQSKGFRAQSPAITNTSATPSEELRNTELAFDFRPSQRWRAVMNVYRYRASNMLFTAGPTASREARTGRGGELEVAWLPTSALKFETTVSTLSAHDNLTGARAPYTPKNSVKLAANWRIRDDWALQLRSEGYWDIVRPSTDRRPPLEDIKLVHATLRHEINHQLTALLAMHNLTNQRTYVPVLSGANSDDYQLLARNISLQLEWRF